MPTITSFMSNNTYTMIRLMMVRAIVLYAKKYNIEEALIYAVIKKESGRNTFAIRIEHHLKKAKWYKRTLLGIEEVEDNHYCSFGLMQIMYGTAKHHGYLFRPFALCNPKRGIKYGVKFLARCIKRYKGNIWDAVAAYNQGNSRYYDVNKNGIKDPGEKYFNQPYVDKVKEFYKDVYGGREYI